MLPREMADLTSLTRLILNDNMISGTIPPELGALTQLKSLYLQNNQHIYLEHDLSNLPPDVAALTAETYLD